jgi:hypothetical protein
LVTAVWLTTALVFLVGLQALNADRNAVRAIARVTAPSVVAAQELGAELADLDTALATALLGSSSERDVANELFELRRSAANRKLVDAANAITQGEADRIPVVVMSEELGRYLELASRAQWLYVGGDRDGALSLLLLATHLMHARILPAAAELDAVDRGQMDRQYDAATAASKRYEAEAMVTGGLLVASLLGAQLFVRLRMRRRLVPALLLATALSVVFSAYLVGRFRGARENLRIARDDAFNSIHFLWRARALAHDATGDEARWLLDRLRADDYESSYRAKMTQLLSRPGPWKVGTPDLSSGRVTGLLIDEARNVTFPGEDQAANAAIATLTDCIAADDRLRALERQGKHADAIELALGARPDEATAAFDRFDAALVRTIAINQEAFDEVTAASDRALRRAEWLDPAFALVIALLAWVGVRSRLREYS